MLMNRVGHFWFDGRGVVVPSPDSNGPPCPYEWSEPCNKNYQKLLQLRFQQGWKGF
jgi:hypothetical protein